MTDKIITFPGAEALPENPVSIERDTRYCAHGKVSLDEHQRVVNCLQCGAVLDAFDFLHRNARTLQMAWESYRRVTHQAEELHSRVVALDRERKRLTAQVKRLQDKAAPVLDVRGKLGGEGGNL